MVKKCKSRRSTRHKGHISHLGAALDLMLAGHDQVIGPDFLMVRRDPFHADIGYLNPQALRTYDQTFVDQFINLKPLRLAIIPADLHAVYQEYKAQREYLCQYQGTAVQYLFKHDLEAAKELGNFDIYLDKIVLRNEAEMNLFYDYLALYRKIEGKRAIVQWALNNPTLVTQQNKSVVTAHARAQFTVLRLDENLAHGAIRVMNIITGYECILMDKALNESRKEGCFFICSVLDRGAYIMTSGGGIPIDATSSAGKSTLTLLKKYLEKLQASKRVLSNDIVQCVQEIYGFCLRGGALEYMTVK